VIVADPPKGIRFPLMVILELTNPELVIFVIVLVEPLMETPANVVRVFPNATFVEPIVMDELVKPELGIVALI